MAYIQISAYLNNLLCDDAQCSCSPKQNSDLVSADTDKYQTWVGASMDVFVSFLYPPAASTPENSTVVFTQLTVCTLQ